MIKVAVVGSRGKMGRMVIDAIAERPAELTCAAQIDVGDDLAAGLATAQVYIDFSAPEASTRTATLAAEAGVAGVIGTTGLTDAHRAALSRAAERIPIVFSPNFSLGVNVLLGLVEQAARALGPEFEMAVQDIHHSAKKDAPSGTALAIADAMRRGRGADDVQVTAFRRGDVVGEHTAGFFGPAERIEITHRAGSRAIFARGAVRAAAWVAGKPARLYGMKDVLGL